MMDEKKLRDAMARYTENDLALVDWLLSRITRAQQSLNDAYTSGLDDQHENGFYLGCVYAYQSVYDKIYDIADQAGAAKDE